MTDRLTAERRSWNMSRIRGRDTKPEVRLRSILHRAGFRFRLHRKDLPGCPDIVLPRYRAAIFLHGCFWHRHKGCRNATTPSTRRQFWEYKFAGTLERDRKNTGMLRNLGWHVITVWECDLKDRPDQILRDICDRLSVDRA